MEVIIRPDAAEVARVAAAHVAHHCRTAGRPPVLGVATGSSPVATYDELARLVASGRLDLTGASAFALDEYVGLPHDHPESYHAVIDRTVTRVLGLDPARVHVPDGAASDLIAAAADYERAIADAGGVDCQILGIGSNGHIGFNEPFSSLSSRTRDKTLTQRTREDNARFFASLEEVPRMCLTQGLGTIRDARACVLMAQGEGKADAVAAMVEGPVTSAWPASVLQLHRHAVVIIDEAAAAKLAYADYFREVYESRPAWERFDEE